jgi:hypothetical protein
MSASGEPGPRREKRALGYWNVRLMAKFVLTKNNIGITSFKKPTIPSFHYSIIPFDN